MRSFVAKCFAVGTGVAILGLILLFGFLQNRAKPSPPEPDSGAIVARGAEVYRREGCQGCHSIGSEGNRRSPLDGVGTRLQRESIRGWIVEPQKMDPTVRKPTYGDLSDEDLEALIVFLENLRES